MLKTASQTVKLLVPLTAVLALVSPASAANIDWTGGTDTDWATGTNWSTGNPPADDLTTDIARFNSGSYTNQPSLTGNRSVAGLLLTTAGTGAVTLGGTNTLTLGGSGINHQASAGALTVNSNLAIGANQTWTASSTNAFTVGGSVTQNAGTVWTMAGTRPVNLNGPVNLNSSAGPYNLVYTSSNATYANGGLVLGADQKWSLAGGSFRVGTLGGTAGITGTGNLALNSGTVANQNGAVVVQSNANTWTFAGNTVLSGYRSQPGRNGFFTYVGLTLTPEIGSTVTAGFGTGSITLNTTSGFGINFRSTVASGGSMPVWSFPNEVIVANGNNGLRPAIFIAGMSRTTGTGVYGAFDHTGQLTLGGQLIMQYDTLANAINAKGPDLTNYVKLGSGGIVLVQSEARTLSVHPGRDQLTGYAFQLNGNISDGAGSANNPLFLAADSGYRVILNGTASTYKNGTIIGNCNAFHLDSGTVGQAAVEVSAGANLGTGNVQILPGGRLYLAGTTDPVASGKAITIQSLSHTAGVLSLNKGATAIPTISSDSEGVIALNGGTTGTSSSAINTLLSGTVGNGRMFLGAQRNITGTTTGGIFTGTTLAAGTSSTYRLGGGWGDLVLDVPSSTTGVLTGSNHVQVGSARINGGGTVTTSDANDFTGTLTVTAPFLLPGTYSSFVGTSIDAFNSPFGSASGDVVIQGGRLYLNQTAASGNITSYKNNLDITSFSTLTVSAANRNTTLAFDGTLTRNNNAMLQVVGNSSSLGTRELITIASGVPASTNGMVAPWIVTGSNNFANYTTQFVDAAYTISSATALNTPPGATDVVQNTLAIAITGNRDMYALKVGGGNVTATGSGPYTLNIGSGGLIPNGVSIGSTTAANNVNLNFGTAEGVVYTNSGTASYLYGKVSGSGGLTKGGTGSVVLTNAGNDFTGNITVNQGTLAAVWDLNDSTQGALGPVTNNIYLNGGFLGFSNAAGGTYRYLSSSRTLTLGPLGGGLDATFGGLAIAAVINSKITGPGALYIGYSNFVNSIPTITNAANDYSGGTVISVQNTSYVYVTSTGKLGQGPVSIQAGGYQPVHMVLQGDANLDYVDALSNHTYLPVQTGLNTNTFFTSANPVMGSLTGEGNVILGNAEGANSTSLTLGLDNRDANFYGTVFSANATRTGSIVKGGTGTFGLYGSNTYTGTTTVSAGTLLAGNPVPSGAAGPFGNATSVITLGDANTGTNDVALYANNAFTIARDVTIANSGTGLATVGGLNTSGTATYSGTLTLDRNGRLSAATGGTVDFTGDITGTGALAKVGGGVVTLSGTKSYFGGTVIDAGLLKVNSNGEINNSSSITVNSGATFQYDNTTTTLIAPITNNGGTVVMADGATVRVASGSPYAGYQSTSVVGLNSQLNLLAGTAGANNDLASTWRVRNASEGDVSTPGTTPPLPGNIYNLISDVVSFTGTGSDLYVLQLSYNEGQIYNIGYGENNLVTDGFLYLSYLNGLTYENGILGNTGNNATSAQQKYLGTFASFQTTYGSTLSNYVGAYGVDTTGNVAWAVVNHNSEWAVVPEPGTLALLAFGSMAVMNIRRKKKNS